MNIDIEYFDDITSTNEVLLKEALEGAEPGRVMVAWRQSGGRGRLGRTFESPEGGIYMSLLVENDDSMLLTARFAVAVKRAIEEYTDRKVGIKWVNDILYNGKKVAGILAQAAGDKVVIGVGINFCTDVRKLSPELQETAISLYRPGQEPDCDAVDLVNAIVRHTFSDEAWLEEYKASSVVLGKKVKVFQAGVQTGSGTAVSIDDNCALHVLDEKKGEMILSTGEITLRMS